MSASNAVRQCWGAAIVCAIAVVGSIAGCSSSSTSAVPSVGSHLRSPGRTSHAATTLDPAYNVIYDFKGGADGMNPESPLVDVNGILYGTTYAGGSFNRGTIFAVTTGGSETVIYSFGSKSIDGERPTGRLFDAQGALWGTTLNASNQSSCGAVFKSTTTGIESVKYLFQGAPDGCAPYNGTLVKSGPLFYGATSGGGSGHGTIYQVTMKGAAKVDYAFGGQPDGAAPDAGLTEVSGTFYGTTSAGGTRNQGTVFRFTPAGVTTIYNFERGRGALPDSDLLRIEGRLYGTTYRGGAYGGGTLFSVTTTGREKVIHSFGQTNDGGLRPIGDLIALNGTLYGVTYFGGTAYSGTVYSMTTSGTETVLHSFEPASGDGGGPIAGLVDVNGTLYGTASSGGMNGGGVVYSITP